MGKVQKKRNCFYFPSSVLSMTSFVSSSWKSCGSSMAAPGEDLLIVHLLKLITTCSPWGSSLNNPEKRLVSRGFSVRAQSLASMSLVHLMLDLRWIRVGVLSQQNRIQCRLYQSSVILNIFLTRAAVVKPLLALWLNSEPR